MKIWRKLLSKRRLALLVAVALATVFPAFSQQVPDKMLKVTLRMESASCSLRGKLQLEILSENSGSHDLIVPRWWGWGWGRTNIRAFDASGKEVVTTFLADELPPPPQPWDFVVLDGGQFVGTPKTTVELLCFLAVLQPPFL